MSFLSSFIDSGLERLLLAATAVAAVGAAFTNGSASNLLAETGGVALGSLLTVSLLDNHKEGEDRKRWQAVRESTLEVLAGAAEDTILRIRLEARWVGGAVIPTVSGNTFESYLREIDELISTLEAATEEESFAALSPVVESSLAVLRPHADRLFGQTSEPELVALLQKIEVEGARLRSWADIELAARESGQAPESLPWSPTADFLKAVKALYLYVNEPRPRSIWQLELAS